MIINEAELSLTMLDTCFPPYMAVKLNTENNSAFPVINLFLLSLQC